MPCGHKLWCNECALSEQIAPVAQWGDHTRNGEAREARVQPGKLCPNCRDPIVKMKKIFGGISNPRNAFQSAFAEQPFDTYAMTRRQVAMFYHTMKDYLVRPVDALTARPTGSLWDYVPEPRLHTAQPLINDARSGVGTTNNEFATQACFVCNTFGPCACTQSDEAELADSMNEAPSSP